VIRGITLTGDATVNSYHRHLQPNNINGTIGLASGTLRIEVEKPQPYSSQF
jgi:hypothetical protein